MGKINISVLDYDERAALVCMYLARLRSDDSRYKQNRTKMLKHLEEKLGFSYGKLKNDKDAFDAYFENGRRGWLDKPLQKRNKMLFRVYEAYKDCTEEEHETAVSEIFEDLKKEAGPFFSIKTKDAETVDKILRKEINIVFSGINVLQESLKEGCLVFVVLGGDRPAWDTGLVGIGVISKEPYDVGYSGRNFRVNLDMKILLDKPIKREDLVPYADTYGTIGIAPVTKWEPNQAVSQVADKNAVALIRAMLDMHPEISDELDAMLDSQLMQRVKGATTKYVGVQVNYSESVTEEMLKDALNPQEDDTQTEDWDPYTREDFLKEVYLSSERYDRIRALLMRKKNLILQGAPGVGKTYIAKRLAYSILGGQDKSRVTSIQFHQSYSYEDFIMGYRPNDKNGFELRKGIFYEFCKRASGDRKNPYFFIIDEINRGNISKIFGELFMLVEGDKRNVELELTYSDELFSVPDNVYLIGMMNTADRSLAMLDYALRRRFAFIDIAPAFDNPGFIAYQTAVSNSKFDSLIGCVKMLNTAIAEDDSLGEGFRIGHSYFSTDEKIDDEWLDSVVEYELIPLLKEYWFDEPGKVKEWSGKLRGAVK